MTDPYVWYPNANIWIHDWGFCWWWPCDTIHIPYIRIRHGSWDKKPILSHESGTRSVRMILPPSPRGGSRAGTSWAKKFPDGEGWRCRNMTKIELVERVPLSHQTLWHVRKLWPGVSGVRVYQELIQIIFKMFYMFYHVLSDHVLSCSSTVDLPVAQDAAVLSKSPGTARWSRGYQTLGCG